jgi:hypothetical protein
MVVGIMIGALGVLFVRWLLATTPHPRVDASVQRRGGDLHIILHRVDRDPRADISVAIERDRSRWN